MKGPPGRSDSGNLQRDRGFEGRVRCESAAIVADGGPTDAPLGEISLSLAEALGGHNPNPRNGAGASVGLFQYVVFPRSRQRPPWRRTVADIAAQVQALLDAIGGWPALRGSAPAADTTLPAARLYGGHAPGGAGAICTQIRRSGKRDTAGVSRGWARWSPVQRAGGARPRGRHLLPLETATHLLPVPT
jgi:hypothetical protein